jgi:hypothetical protein
MQIDKGKVKTIAGGSHTIGYGIGSQKEQLMPLWTVK